MSTSLSERKSFEISKWEVWQAFQRVKANKGAPGTDGVTIEDFESDLEGNLYNVWNRMSSGSYFPPPVRAVPIPKPGGGGSGRWECRPSRTGLPKPWSRLDWRNGRS